VVGAGVVGMSAAAALLDVGQQDLTSYEPGAIMGERSVGSTRIFRLAHTDPDLVRLAQQAREGFDRWANDAGQPMVIGSECVITGSDMADRAAAMAKVGVDYELVGAGSGRLRLPVVEEPAAALVDVGGGVDVDAVRAFLTARAGATVVRGGSTRWTSPPAGPRPSRATAARLSTTPCSSRPVPTPRTLPRRSGSTPHRCSRTMSGSRSASMVTVGSRGSTSRPAPRGRTSTKPGGGSGQ